jgi:CBS domain-containing protein
MMISVDELMTRSPITLGPDDKLDKAAKLMKEHRIRHVPIVDQHDHLLGIITQRDVLAATKEVDTYQIKQVMRRTVRTTTPESSLRAAAMQMQKHKIGSLPVMESDQVIGILTDSDFVGLSITLLEQMEEAENDNFEEVDDEDDLPFVSEYNPE